MFNSLPSKPSVASKINEKSETFNLKKGTNKVKMHYEISNPKRWWCNGLGFPHQYEFHFSLEQNHFQLIHHLIQLKNLH